jgi:MFS family permease
MAFFLGFVIGPVILQDMVLDSFMPFLAGAIGTAVASVPILLARRLAPEFCGDASRDLMTAIKMTPAAMIAAFIGGFAEIGILSLIPNVALSAGLSESDALRLLSITTIGGIVLQFPIGWLSDKTSRFAVTIALSITFIVLVLALPMVLGTSEPTGVVAFLLGGVILGFYTLGLAVIGERVDASRLAAANAAFLLMYQAGSILGPLAAGIAMTMAPLAGFVVSMVALMSVCAIAVIVLERSERRRAHAEI